MSLRERGPARRPLLALVLLFAALQAGFFVSSLVAAAVPNGPIVSHLKSAIHTGEWSSLDYTKGTLGDEVDHYTECIALTIGVGRTGYHNFVANALADPELGPCDTAVPRLEKGHANGPAHQDYFRYWHGYTIVTRPVLAVLGVQALRVLVAVLLVVAFAFLIASMVRRAGWLTAAFFVVPLLLTVDFWDLPGSIPHAFSMAVAFAGGAVVLLRVRAGRVGDGWSWLRWPLVVGCLYGFVDLMTNPPLAWGLTAWCAGVAAFVCTRSARTALAAGAASAGVWAVGYGGTWAVKWLLDIALFGWRAFRTQIVHEIAYRAGGAFTFRDVVNLNLMFWVGLVHHRSLIVLLVLIAAGVTLLVSRLLGRPFRRGVAVWAVLVWPAVLTFVWYAVVREQSFIQAFFTYRSLAMSLALVAASAAASIWGRSTAPDGAGNQVAPSPEGDQAAPLPQGVQAAPLPQGVQAAPLPQGVQAAPLPQGVQAALPPDDGRLVSADL